jgi:hypothetical protein
MPSRSAAIAIRRASRGKPIDGKELAGGREFDIADGHIVGSNITPDRGDRDRQVEHRPDCLRAAQRQAAGRFDNRPADAFAILSATYRTAMPKRSRCI